MQQLTRLKLSLSFQQPTCFTKICDWSQNLAPVTTISGRNQHIAFVHQLYPQTTDNPSPIGVTTSCSNGSSVFCKCEGNEKPISTNCSRLQDKNGHASSKYSFTGKASATPVWTFSSLQCQEFSRFKSMLQGHLILQRSIGPRLCPARQHGILTRTFTVNISKAMTINSVEEVQVPTLTEMKRHLKNAGIDFQTGYTCLATICPFCSITAKGAKNKTSKKMFINMTTGHCNCQCSKVSGSWQFLHDSMAIAKHQGCKNLSSFIDPTAATIDEEDVKGHRSDMQKVQTVWDEAVEMSMCQGPGPDKLRALMGIEQISTQTLERFNVRYNRQQQAFVLPLYGHGELLRGVKVLEVRKVGEGREVEETLFPRHDQSSLFGFHLIRPKDGETVLVSNVLDALVVHQMTGQTVLALPNGSASLPQGILPLLEQFHKITLWFGNDMRSWEAAKQFARKLNTKRCHFIRPLDCHPPALVALQQGLSLGNILKQANPMSHKSIVSFRSLREEVLGELSHAEQVAGVKWKRFPTLNKYLKGHRRGELSVFTGPTGSGKTTFMAEYSLDLCTQGVNTLWGSFEIQNVRLAKVMLTQYAQLNLERNIEKFDRWADKFEMLPLYFMTFHGQQNLKAVIEAMSHAVYVHDIEHVVVDNLQFMVGYSDKNFMLERFAMYDHIIAAFRKFATSNNCHVTVVIHPRKENASEELQTASIFGSAKASQEADNVLILQDRRLTALRGRKYIQVVKNRFDGDLGIMPLYFNKETRTMSPPSKLRNKKATGAKTSKPGEADEPDDSYELFEELMLVSRQEDELGRGE